MKLTLKNQVEILHLVTPQCKNALNHIGIHSIHDLLYHFPRDWQDLTQVVAIAQIKPNERASVRAKLKQIRHHCSPRRRMHISTGLLEDATGNIAAVWFNQPFLKNSLQAGREYYFHGKVQIYAEKGKQTLQLQNPAFELVKEDTIHTAGLIPQYELTEGITQKQLRYFLKQSLAAADQIEDWMPAQIRTNLDLAPLQTAIANIHFPESQEQLAAARARLAFDELFLFQMAFLSYKRKLKILPAPRFALNTSLVKKFVESLPFKLTDSQRLAAWEILKDIGQNHPMNRLLEGDVGSGKTVVAGTAMLEVAKAGYQSVLLAPTEILAWQHYQTLKELFKHTNLEIALLTRSHKTLSTPPFREGGDPPASSRPPETTTCRAGEASRAGEEGVRPTEIINSVASGQTKIIIGTHALLQEQVRFNRIGLLVVDEQHRFGVKQRGQLLTETQTNADTGQKLSVSSQPKSVKMVPHLLTMTATPIPRTLALAFYGDLDISQLTELPSGRKKIITKLVEPQKRAAAYEFIRKEIQKGRQVYVVTPLIGESSPLPTPRPNAPGGQAPPQGEGMGNASTTLQEGISPLLSSPLRGEEKGGGEIKEAVVEVEKLREIFPEFRIGLLHGRMKGEEKKKIMDEFGAGRLDVLVSTTVIEVGVDVPNATIMVIENAERFGLAQLHQLRGRVGRSDLQSYCLLFAERASETTKNRLEAVVKSTNGFELAEKDLDLRGPGEVLGQRQSGYIPFKIAKLSDRKMIKLAKTEAEKLLDNDSKLASAPLLKQKIESLSRNIHLE